MSFSALVVWFLSIGCEASIRTHAKQPDKAVLAGVAWLPVVGWLLLNMHSWHVAMAWRQNASSALKAT